MAAPEEERLDNVKNFKVFNLKFSKSSKHSHQILLKAHEVREYDEKKPPERTLFVVNLPPYVDEVSLKTMFEHFGSVVQVIIHGKEKKGESEMVGHYPILDPIKPVNGFQRAYIVFNSVKAVKKIMNEKNIEALVLSTPKDPVTTGVQKWTEMYNNSFVNWERLKDEVVRKVEECDKQALEERQEAQKREADSEGWVTVTSKRKRMPMKKNEFEERQKKKKGKKKDLLAFYSFQARQKKIDRVEQLRNKFEEDKKRICQMRAARKFKPA